MTWHYGIIHHLNCLGDYFLVHEIYQDADRVSWTKEGIKIFGEDKEEVLEQLKKITDDVQKHGVVFKVNMQDEIVP